MAEQPPGFQFEEVPIDEARRMGRGPRIAPELYNALKDKIQSLDNTATRLMVPEGTNVTTMKNRILRVAAELNIPVTIRRVPGGLLFWHSSEEDLQQATEVGARLQTRRQTGTTAQRRPQARPRGRRPKGHPLSVHTPTRVPPEAIRRQRALRSWERAHHGAWAASRAP